MVRRSYTVECGYIMRIRLDTPWGEVYQAEAHLTGELVRQHGLRAWRHERRRMVRSLVANVAFHESAILDEELKHKRIAWLHDQRGARR